MDLNIISWNVNFIHDNWSNRLMKINKRLEKEQREAWLRNYRAMQLNCHVGHLMGTVGVSLFLSSFCKKKTHI